jgi:hypothetical protein
MVGYDLYGFEEGELAAIGRALELALDLAFDRHDSDYQGGDYLKSGKRGEENFMLKNNVDPYEDEAAEFDFPQYPVIFYINATPRSEALKEKILGIAGAVLLRHRERT